MDEDKDGLEGSWQFVSKALRYGAGVAVHLSKLRPRGTENKHGMIASGPVGSWRSIPSSTRSFVAAEPTATVP
jgi:ribonucleotide reductase alpha subunit